MTNLESKYLDFFTMLYNKKYFSINKELKSRRIDTYIKNALCELHYISGKGRNYKWVGNLPNIDDLKTIIKTKEDIKSKVEVKKEEDIFERQDVKTAVTLLKSLGCKISKPVTIFKEL